MNRRLEVFIPSVDFLLMRTSSVMRRELDIPVQTEYHLSCCSAGQVSSFPATCPVF